MRWPALLALQAVCVVRDASGLHRTSATPRVDAATPKEGPKAEPQDNESERAANRKTGWSGWAPAEDSQPKREAVVIPVLLVDECIAKRAFSLVQSVGKSRDVVLLHGEEAPPDELREPLERAGVIFALQPHVSSELMSFGGIRSLTTKPSFIVWAALRSNKYSFFWHVEDDVFFTGPWERFFDTYSHSLASVVARLSKPSDAHNQEWLGSCFTDKFTSCNAHYLYKTSWPVLRLSGRLALALVQALQKGASGHHEVLTGTLCRRNKVWCSVENMEKGHEELFGTFQLAGWGDFKGPMTFDPHGLACGPGSACRELRRRWAGEDGEFHQDIKCGGHCCSLRKLAHHSGLERASDLPSNKLFHPVKCRADLCGHPSAGAESLRRSLGENGTRLWKIPTRTSATPLANPHEEISAH
mmetsp:Transcript_88385/g.250489  ORF Transcript_88385/g.250489 Transcript_88385/m.250489 type:complete len:414 (-) Transcript_88385:36-1277(-)